jgi:4-hydroxy-tetrahydrodipicolinate synthase
MKKSELKKWAKANLVGVENTTMPSFTADLSELDEVGIRHDVEQAIAHGFFSTLVATETGLTFEEQKRFLSIVTDAARGRIHVSTSILFDSFERATQMIAHAEKAGCQTILLGFPANWYPQSGQEVLEKTQELCSLTDMAVVIYPSPHFNLQRLHPSGYPLEILPQVADIENVVAIKAGEWALFAECHARVGDRLLINNPVERYLPNTVMAYGQQWIGAGCYEVLQSPEQPNVVEYFKLLREKKFEPAMEIYWKLAPARQIFEQQFNQTVMSGTYNWTMQKYYQWCVGGNGGFTRQPAMKPHQHELDQTKMAFSMIGINPREPDAEFYLGRANAARLAAKG